MKTIERVELKSAKILTPMEMNDIHFETGAHSEMEKDQGGVSGSAAGGK